VLLEHSETSVGDEAMKCEIDNGGGKSMSIHVEQRSRLRYGANGNEHKRVARERRANFFPDRNVFLHHEDAVRCDFGLNLMPV